MDNPMFYKPEIRRRIVNRRKQLDQAAVQIAAKEVAAQLITFPALLNSKHIAYYMPIDGELDPRAIIDCEHNQQKSLYLPVILNETQLAFYPHSKDDELIENTYRILEPNVDGKHAFSTSDLDVVFVPLISFDSKCNRIGWGKGYYDHTFAFINEHPNEKRPLLIGLGYEFQKIDAITPNKWDVPLDFVVTENQIYQR